MPLRTGKRLSTCARLDCRRQDELDVRQLGQEIHDVTLGRSPVHIIVLAEFACDRVRTRGRGQPFPDEPTDFVKSVENAAIAIQERGLLTKRRRHHLVAAAD